MLANGNVLIRELNEDATGTFFQINLKTSRVQINHGVRFLNERIITLEELEKEYPAIHAKLLEKDSLAESTT